MPEHRIFVTYRRPAHGAAIQRMLEVLRRAVVPGVALVDAGGPGDVPAPDACDAVLVLIDENWAGAIVRFDGPAKAMRREIETAIRAGVPVLPVILGGPRPDADDVPESLAPMFARGSAVIGAPDEATVWDQLIEPLCGMLRSGEAAHWYEPPEAAAVGAEPEEYEPDIAGDGSDGDGGAAEAGEDRGEADPAPARDTLRPKASRTAPTIRATQNSGLSRPRPSVILTPRGTVGRPARGPVGRPARGPAAGPAAGPGAPATSAAGQEVEGRVFARERMKPGRRAGVRFFLHLPGQIGEVRQMAAEADPRATEQSATTLGARLAPGDRVTVALSVELASVADPVRTKTWRGQPLPFDFVVTAPAAGFEEVYADIAVYLNDQPIGKVGWMIFEDTGDAPAPPATERQALNRYRQAFVSYSSRDRAEVLRRVQGLRAAGVEVFMDLLDLKPGERYAELLQTEARGADLFVLCWSKNAAQSEWVKKEALWALEHARRSTDRRPDLRPIVLGPPPPPAPWPELASVHLNDMIAYVIAVEDGLRQG